MWHRLRRASRAQTIRHTSKPQKLPLQTNDIASLGSSLSREIGVSVSTPTATTQLADPLASQRPGKPRIPCRPSLTTLGRGAQIISRAEHLCAAAERFE